MLNNIGNEAKVPIAFRKNIDYSIKVTKQNLNCAGGKNRLQNKAQENLKSEIGSSVGEHGQHTIQGIDIKISECTLTTAINNIELALKNYAGELGNRLSFIRPTKQSIQEKMDKRESSLLQNSFRNWPVENAWLEYQKRAADFMKSWTDEERGTFLDKIAIYGKNFAAVATCIPSKTIKQCVEYYYTTKKTENYKQKFGKAWKRIAINNKRKNKKGQQNGKKCKSPLMPKSKIEKKKVVNDPRIEKRKENSLKCIEEDAQRQNVGKKEQKIQKTDEINGIKKQKKERAPRKFEIDHIFGKRPDPFQKGKIEYYVFWKNYSRTSATWEPEENLRRCGCEDSIDKYEKRDDDTEEDNEN